ncbi:hypothetical protein FRC01_002553 [Tulasnella sp. 417]|nr:hypothetical protein FRC01_002553 [Tulasnella sp. 417]
MAVFIVEIIMQILRNLGKSELPAAARVCSSWTGVALDMLWKEMESVLPIMALLGPISIREGGWDWDNGVPSGDWSRFASYAKRVQSLSYCTSGNGDDAFLEQMSFHVPARWLDYIAGHQSRYLLPQIRKIEWSCNHDNQLDMILPFLSPTIKDVKIKPWWGVSLMGMSSLLGALQCALPSGVRALTLNLDYTQHGGERSEAFESLLESLGELQELRVPYYPMVPAMFKSSRLRVLEVGCDLESGIDVNALLSQLADTCPLLEELRIMFSGDSNLNFQLISPLVGCSKLRSLDMDYWGTFDLNAAEVSRMGRAWRELEVLHIASRRRYDDPDDPALGMPFGLLVAFAECFSPKLRKLGLYVSTHDIPAPPNPPVSFPNLQVLYVGTSPFESDKAKVLKAFAFFSRLLPQGIGITTSSRWSWSRERSVFDERSWGGENNSWNVLSRMLSQGETADILAELDSAPPGIGWGLNWAATALGAPVWNTEWVVDGGGDWNPPNEGGDWNPPNHGGGWNPPNHGGGWNPPNQGGDW